MASVARRLVGSGIAYLFFGLFMLYMGLCASGIIQGGDIPRGNFVAAVSIGIAILDLIIGTRRLFSWGGACPYCGFSKITLFRDKTSTFCRACKNQIVRKGLLLYRAE